MPLFRFVNYLSIMNAPRISVIIPVYNVERYIHRCIKSLQAQTFYDFEILLIDDGSSDQSGLICDEYAKEDRRIRVIHKKNEGVSRARQLGIDLSKGEYTIHVDSDDWVESKMLEGLYRTAKEQNADMVICDYYYNDAYAQKKHIQSPSALDHLTVLKEILQLKLHGSCGNKLVRLECYKRFSVRFPVDINYSEDLIANVELLLHPLRVYYIPKAYYHYCINPASITNNYTIQTYCQRKKAYFKLEEILPVELECSLKNLAISIKMEAFSNGLMSKKEFQSFAPMSMCEILSSSYLSIVRKIILVVSFVLSFKIGYILYALLRSLKKYLRKQ